MTVGNHLRETGSVFGGLRLRLAGIVLALIAFVGCVPPQIAQAQQVTITLDPSERHQTWRAWETTTVFDWPIPDVPLRDEVYDHLLDVIGIGRVRVEVYAGDENTRTTIADLFAGKSDNEQLRLYRYQTVNDNDDPFVLNPAGFHWDDLDWRIKTIWLPLKAKADARGQTLEFSLNYVAFTDQSKGGPYIHDQPEEYAEFILATFLHLKQTYGIVPDSLEMILEPDLIPQWTPEKFAQAAAAVTRRLTAAGFRPRIILPSTTSAAAASDWFDAVAATPGAMDLVAELGFHLYRKANGDAMKAIGERGRKYGIETGMLEYWLGKGTHDFLFKCLKLAHISVWQSRAYLGYSDEHPDAPPGQRLTEPEDVRMNLLYFQSIKRGAVRIGASSDAQRAVDAVAFVNPGDKWSVIAEAREAGDVRIVGLPAGRYWVTTATAAGNFTRADPVEVAQGDTLTATMPDVGVLAVSELKPVGSGDRPNGFPPPP
jgi:hypothetical protein